MTKMLISVFYESEVLTQETFLWLLNSAESFSWARVTE